MLLEGRVMHMRTSPIANRFEYKNIYLYLPIAAKGFKKQIKSRFFSQNNFNLFSFHDSDHNLGLDLEPQENCQQNLNHKTNLEDDFYCFRQINKIFKDNQINNIENIILISHPRIFGYVFNPASFWLGFDKNENLIASLVEVSNTFSQKHSYLLFNENLEPILENQWLQAQKKFHVSPFFKNIGEYKFRFVIKENQLEFYINYYVENNLQLATSLKCCFCNLSDKNLLTSIVKMPFLMFKTIYLIHFQALKLWLFKRVKYNSLPKQSKVKLTISKNAKK